MTFPIHNCDHNQPIVNPTDKKFGGTYVEDKRLVIIVSPETNPDEFPPDDRDPDGNIINPSCDSDKQPWPANGGTGEMDEGIDEYCQEGNNLGPYDHSFTVGFYTVHIRLDSYTV